MIRRLDYATLQRVSAHPETLNASGIRALVDDARDREEEIERLRAIERVAKEWADYHTPEDKRVEASWQKTLLAHILAGRVPGKGEI